MPEDDVRHRLQIFVQLFRTAPPGSLFSVNVVKPRTSEKNTVSFRFSPSNRNNCEVVHYVAAPIAVTLPLERPPRGEQLAVHDEVRGAPGSPWHGRCPSGIGKAIVHHVDRWGAGRGASRRTPLRAAASAPAAARTVRDAPTATAGSAVNTTISRNPSHAGDRVTASLCSRLSNAVARGDTPGGRLRHRPSAGPRTRPPHSAPMNTILYPELGKPDASVPMHRTLQDASCTPSGSAGIRGSCLRRSGATRTKM